MIISESTDVGMKREFNEDSYKAQLFNGGKFGFAVVCDGMGGMAAGNVASQTAVDTIAKAAENNLNFNASPNSLADMLNRFIQSANAVVYDMAVADQNLKGMGTTVVTAVLKGDTVSFAHAGDSRAYLYSDGLLTQITTDHSVVQSMVESGHITEDEAKNHPNKNIITRAVGVHPDIEVDTGVLDIKKDDIILLCTDGLTNCVDHASMQELIGNTDFSDLAKTLVDLANKNGGVVNITVVAIKNN